MAQPKSESVSVGFDPRIKLEFHGAKVTYDGGLLTYRDLEDALGLFESVFHMMLPSRWSGVAHWHLPAFIPHIFCKIERSTSRKYLIKQFRSSNMRVSTGL